MQRTQKKRRGGNWTEKNREKERREGEVRADKNDDMDGIGVTAPLETRHARGLGVGEGGGDTNFPLRPIPRAGNPLRESAQSCTIVSLFQGRRKTGKSPWGVCNGYLFLPLWEGKEREEKKVQNREYFYLNACARVTPDSFTIIYNSDDIEMKREKEI